MEDFQSPFKLPTDEEVFITREAERLQKQEAKEKAKNMTIWEKQTASTKTQLKRPKDGDFNIKPIEEGPIPQYVRNKEKNLITAALEIVNQRGKMPQNQKTENTRDYVEQKKEIFRVEMKYRILKEEREKIKKRISNKEQALKRSEELLDQDQKKFTDHMEKNKLLKEEAIAQANAEALAKKEKDGEIKQLEQRKAGISAEISRNEEYLEVLKKHKEFVEQLTPPEWLEARQRILREKYEVVKKNWIWKQNADDVESLVDGEVESQQSQGSFRKRTDRKQAALEAKFDEMVSKGLIDVFTEEDEQMYFTNPDELTAILKELEDKNLFLIELIQVMDHQLEVTKSEYDDLKKKNDDKFDDSKRNKEHFGLQLKTMETKISQINKRKSNIENKKETTRAVQILKNEISKCFTSLGHDEDSARLPIEMLKIIEESIHGLLRKLSVLRSIDPKHVEDLEGQKEKIRRDYGRDLKAELEEKKIQERITLAQKRVEGPSFRKIGRPPMNKVLFQKKRVEKEVKHIQKSEEELIRDFIEETTS